jgi:hypothetical protein
VESQTGSTVSRTTRWCGAGAVLAGLLATLAILDPLHLRYAGWYTTALVMLTIVLATVAAASAVSGRLGRSLTAVAGVLVALAWSGMVWFAVQFAGDERVVEEVGSGRHQLVLVQGFAWVDPIYTVRLRAGSGPFAQESLVWQGLAEGPAPTSVRFRDEETVEVVASEVCGYRSTFNSTTLEVDPVHRPLRLDGC